MPRGFVGSRRGWIPVAIAVGLACSAPNEWPASGVVREVFVAERQLKIEHGDIEGLMPAMTMSFDVGESVSLEGLAPGQFVEFRLRKEGNRYEVVALDAPGMESSGGVPVEKPPLLDASEPAPDFSLGTARGGWVTLASLAGEPVLLDFIFTRCPGPCPILTGIHADARAGLSDAERARLRSVSITLDPAFDTPEVLDGYRRARRLDDANWSFLTGPEQDVARVVRAFGVGAIRNEAGDLDHTVATFLIDARGRIARRYLGTRHTPEELQRDVRELLDAAPRSS